MMLGLGAPTGYRGGVPVPNGWAEETYRVREAAAYLEQLRDERKYSQTLLDRTKVLQDEVRALKQASGRVPGTLKEVLDEKLRHVRRVQALEGEQSKLTEKLAKCNYRVGNWNRMYAKQKKKYEDTAIDAQQIVMDWVKEAGRLRKEIAASQDALNAQVADLESRLRIAEEDLRQEQQKTVALDAELKTAGERPVTPPERTTGDTGPSSSASAAPPPAAAPLPETPQEIRALERKQLEELATKLTEDLRKERGIMTDEEKLVAVKEQQTQMAAFVKVLNNPAEMAKLTATERAAVYTERDLSIALLSDEELKRLFRAMTQVYLKAPIEEWTEETKQALIQTRLSKDTSEEEKQALLEEYTTERMIKAAEMILIRMGTFLKLEGPEKRRQSLDKEAEAKRSEVESTKRNAAARDAQIKKQREEETFNREVYDKWEPTWRLIVEGRFPQDNQEAKELKRRFERNMYLPLLVNPNPESVDSNKYWGNKREGIRQPAGDMKEAELRGLIHHLKHAVKKNAWMKQFIDLVSAKLEKTDAALVLPGFMSFPELFEPEPSSPPVAPLVVPSLGGGGAIPEPPKAPPPGLLAGIIGGVALKSRGKASAPEPAPDAGPPKGFLAELGAQRKKREERDRQIQAGTIVIQDPREEKLRKAREAKEKGESASGWMPALNLRM